MFYFQLLITAHFQGKQTKKICRERKRIAGMCLCVLLSSSPPLSTQSTSKASFHLTETSQNSNTPSFLLPNLLSFALTVSLASSPLSLAIPSLNSQSSLLPPTTPFSQSKSLQVGLENGYVRTLFSFDGFAFFLLIMV